MGKNWNVPTVCLEPEVQQFRKNCICQMFTLAFVTAFDISERQRVIIRPFPQITEKMGKGLLFNNEHQLCREITHRSVFRLCWEDSSQKLFFPMQISPGQKVLLNFEVSRLNTCPALESFAIWREIDMDFWLNKDGDKLSLNCNWCHNYVPLKIHSGLFLYALIC